MIFAVAILISAGFALSQPSKTKRLQTSIGVPTLQKEPKPPRAPSPTSIPAQKILPTDYHVFQTFNNCGPAALSMTLDHYGISASQQELGAALRPHQNQAGVDDDKSTTLEELAQKSIDYGFIPYHRPAGSIELLERFIAADMPVIIRTITKPGEDIGHYRVIKGYDQNSRQIIQDDSLENKNLSFSYDYLAQIWEVYNFEYLVLVPQDKKDIASAILGYMVDESVAWSRAKRATLTRLEVNPNDQNARFNLSVALTHLGEHEAAIVEYEKIAAALASRTLWYQIEPLESYLALNKHEALFAITDGIFEGGNRAYSEAYFLRGRSLIARGDGAGAKAELERAVFYNQGYAPAHDLLQSLE